MSEIYFSGDPETDSARRHLERVLRGQPRQRWGWVAAFMAGATAWSLWRVRRNRQNGNGQTAGVNPQAGGPRTVAEPPTRSGPAPDGSAGS